eukprot:TRINITY_DN2092_c0_g1_i1.p1 TRINITY_DN2092_c0_g1~~TRINITY_DN2092_c0_g1_i1.p1  ORF type:complete len:288 (-),score=73.15 TRINITY_DN2092_c0_g1_i1:304-1041(-)
MAAEHSFSPGHADNLINLKTLLGTLQSRLDSLQCFYCERTFKSAKVLRKHMKTKRHLRINPRLSFYDQFYVLNYARCKDDEEEEEGKSCGSDSGEVAPAAATTSEPDQLLEWVEDEPQDRKTVCLICELVLDTPRLMLDHCTAAHHFDLRAIKSQLDLGFYDTVMLINFVRTTCAKCTCVQCDAVFADRAQLLGHMNSTDHTFPANDEWRSPCNLLPALSPDPLLFSLSSVMDKTPTVNPATPNT